jgi:hypothetical protein
VEGLLSYRVVNPSRSRKCQWRRAQWLAWMFLKGYAKWPSGRNGLSRASNCSAPAFPPAPSRSASPAGGGSSCIEASTHSSPARPRGASGYGPPSCGQALRPPSSCTSRAVWSRQPSRIARRLGPASKKPCWIWCRRPRTWTTWSDGLQPASGTGVPPKQCCTARWYCGNGHAGAPTLTTFLPQQETASIRRSNTAITVMWKKHMRFRVRRVR